MLFDSHVALLLDAAVALVNGLTEGEARGKGFAAPADGPQLTAAVQDALPKTPSGPRAVSAADGERLAATARRMRVVFQAVDAGLEDDAAAAVNALLRDTGARPQLDRAAGEPWQMHFHGADDTLAVGWGAGCATALALVVGGGLTSRLGVCAAARCDRVYVDASRNAGRQFCSTACQNRTKAAAFRARRGSS